MRSGVLKAGLRAGVLAGLVSGILLGAVLYVVSSAYVSVIRAELAGSIPANSPFSLDQLVSFTIGADFVLSIVGGLIGGAVLGLVFAWAEPRFGKNGSLVSKGLVFGMVLWGIDILENVTALAYSVRFFVLAVAAGLLANVVFGYILGRSYGRMRDRTARVSA